MTSLKNILLSSLIAIIFFAVGFYVGGLLKEIPAGITADENNKAYEHGWADAKQRLVETGYYNKAEIGEVSSLSGKIISIESEGFIMEVGLLRPLDDPGLKTRKIIYDQNTKFYKIEKKDEKVYQQEEQKFKDDLTNADNAPSLFQSVPAAKNDLRELQNLNVIAGADISEEKEILAKEITIYYSSE